MLPAIFLLLLIDSFADSTTTVPMKYVSQPTRSQEMAEFSLYQKYFEPISVAKTTFENKNGNIIYFDNLNKNEYVQYGNADSDNEDGNTYKGIVDNVNKNGNTYAGSEEIVNKNRNIYDGSFHNGNKNGNIYDGSVHNGNKNGNTYAGSEETVNKNRNIYDGSFHNGNKNGNIYDGSVHNGNKNGNIYDGSVPNATKNENIHDGSGHNGNENGNIYDGSVHNGNKNGNKYAGNMHVGGVEIVNKKGNSQVGSAENVNKNENIYVGSLHKYCVSFKTCTECIRSTYYHCGWCHHYGCTHRPDLLCPKAFSKPTKYKRNICPKVFHKGPMYVHIGKINIQLGIRISDPIMYDYEVTCLISFPRSNREIYVIGKFVNKEVVCGQFSNNDVRDLADTEDPMASVRVVWGGQEPYSNAIPLVLYECGSMAKDQCTYSTRHKCEWCDKVRCTIAKCRYAHSRRELLNNTADGYSLVKVFFNQNYFPVYRI